MRFWSLLLRLGIHVPLSCRAEVFLRLVHCFDMLLGQPGWFAMKIRGNGRGNYYCTTTAITTNPMYKKKKKKKGSNKEKEALLNTLAITRSLARTSKVKSKCRIHRGETQNRAKLGYLSSYATSIKTVMLKSFILLLCRLDLPLPRTICPR